MTLDTVMLKSGWEVQRYPNGEIVMALDWSDTAYVMSPEDALLLGQTLETMALKDPSRGNK